MIHLQSSAGTGRVALVVLIRLAALFLFCSTALAQATAPVRHVVLISVDGLRPEFYRDPSWPAPHLQALARRGLAAEGVEGVFPTLTYPSHTTLSTGARPARHGIVYNTRFDPQSGSVRWYQRASEVRATTLWDAVRAAGLKSASVNWPITSGAPIDYNLPETFSYETPEDRRPSISAEATPAGLFEEIQRHATGTLSARDVYYKYPAVDRNNARALAYLIRTYKPSLAAIHLVYADAAQHEHGRDGDAVRQAVADIDAAIAVILEGIQQAGLEAQTTVIVTGDHGFVDTHTAIAPNVWLRAAGLLGQGDGERGDDWKAVFHSGGGTTFLQLRDPADQTTLRQIRTLLAGLPSGTRRLFRVVEREELQRSGADARASLALVAEPGLGFVGASRGAPLKPQRGGAHGYAPDLVAVRTGFVAAGAGLSGTGNLPLLHLEDIAPTVAALLGLALPDAEGVVLPGVVAPADPGR